MRLSRVSWSGIVLILFSYAGCIHEAELVPAPDAQRIQGSSRAAIGEAAGVRAVVVPGNWRGDPPDLPEVITPIDVSIENHSDRQIRVVYADFALITQSGYRLAALPPHNLRAGPAAENESTRADVVLVQHRGGVGHEHFGGGGHFGGHEFFEHHGFVHDGFRIVPYYAPFYPGVPLWDAYVWDWPYYDMYYPAWPEQLPTQAMLQEALPEGALDAGGFVRGFVYFPALRSGHYAVTFSMSVVDAQTKQQLGSINIPFLVR